MMVNWQVTATTLYCEAMDDEVTVMVFKDGSVKCTGEKKYHRPDNGTAKLLKDKASKVNREFSCVGVSCPQATQYRDKLFAEEKDSK